MRTFPVESPDAPPDRTGAGGRPGGFGDGDGLGSYSSSWDVTFDDARLGSAGGAGAGAGFFPAPPPLKASDAAATRPTELAISGFAAYFLSQTTDDSDNSLY